VIIKFRDFIISFGCGFPNGHFITTLINLTRCPQRRNDVLRRVVEQNVSTDDVPCDVVVIDVRLTDVVAAVVVSIATFEFVAQNVDDVLSVAASVVDGRRRQKSDAEADCFAFATKNLERTARQKMALLLAKRRYTIATNQNDAHQNNTRQNDIH
jgi:hypothetical protein